MRAWQAGQKNIVLQGDINHNRKIAEAMGLYIPFCEYDRDKFANTHQTSCHIIHQKWAITPQLGQPDPGHGQQIIQAIENAVIGVKAGEFSAIVTNPIAKDNLYQAGFNYPGHTEFLAYLDGGYKRPVMMLANAELRVIPLTVHIPLSAVETAIKNEDVSETILIISASLKRFFGASQPHIAVAGLNPHAGEAGYLGRFEIDRLAPILASLSSNDFQLSGPYSADSLFHKQARKNYDAVLCMYHDQALIPIKTIDFLTALMSH